MTQVLLYDRRGTVERVDAAELRAGRLELDPALHRRAVVHAQGREFVAVPLLRAEGLAGTLCLHETTTGRWLEQSREGPPIEVDGRPLPRRLEVPATWLSAVITPDYFPWVDRELVSSPSWDARPFSYSRFCADADGAARELAARLSELWRGGAGEAPIIAELRREGHDLWSLDGEYRIWGGDYMRPAPGRGLYLDVGTSTEVSFRPREG